MLPQVLEAVNRVLESTSGSTHGLRPQFAASTATNVIVELEESIRSYHPVSQSCLPAVKAWAEAARLCAIATTALMEGLTEMYDRQTAVYEHPETLSQALKDIAADEPGAVFDAGHWHRLYCRPYNLACSRAVKAEAAAWKAVAKMPHN